MPSAPARAPARAHGAPSRAKAPDHDVLQHGEVRKRAHAPGRCARCRAGRARWGRRPVMGCAEPADLAAVGQQEAVEHVEERGLARAVRPDDAEDLALAHVEAHVGQRLQPDERLARCRAPRAATRARGAGGGTAAARPRRRGRSASPSRAARARRACRAHAPVEALGRVQHDRPSARRRRRRPGCRAGDRPRWCRGSRSPES